MIRHINTMPAPGASEIGWVYANEDGISQVSGTGAQCMSRNDGPNRRAFFRSARMTALVGAVGTSASLGTAAAFEADATQGGKYDFDTPYNRIGTDCITWDR